MSLESIVVNILNNKDFPLDDNGMDKSLLRDKVQECIDNIRSGKWSSANLSIPCLGHVNVVDINVIVQKDSSGRMFFALLGGDLKKYCSRLMHIVIKDKWGKTTHYPQNGTHFAKIYPFVGCCIPIMIDMAINLRILDVHLRKQRTRGEVVDVENILGIHIPVEIPEFFHYQRDFLESNFSNPLNPLKTGVGKYTFGKNGVTARKITATLRYILETFGQFRDQIYPVNISGYEISCFSKSRFTFALTGWLRHERLLVKHNDIIFVVDPWKRGLRQDIIEELVTTNSDTQFEFLTRSVKDQGREGSCVLCCVARMLQMASNISVLGGDVVTSTIYQFADEPLLDFYAFLTAVVFRHS